MSLILLASVQKCHIWILAQLPTATSIRTIWTQIVWDNYQKLMMPFHVFVTTHYGGNHFKDKYSLFFAEALWWIAPSEKGGGIILPTGVGIPKPFILT